MTSNIPPGFMREHATLGNFRQNSVNQFATPDWFRDYYQSVVKKSSLDGISMDKITEQKFMMMQNMRQPDRTAYLHQGILNRRNFVLTEVMPWILTDKLVQEEKMIVFDFSDINIVPYGAWAGNITSSERSVHSRLQRFGHGFTIDATILSERANQGIETGLRYIEGLFTQLFTDIATAATCIGLKALMSSVTLDDYYKSALCDWVHDKEASLMKDVGAWLCFARRNSSSNKIYPYLSLAKKIISSSGYEANILIMPEGSEGLIVTAIRADTQIYHWRWDIMENRIVQFPSRETLDMIDNVSVRTAPTFKLMHYAEKSHEHISNIQHENATISEWYLMNTHDIADPLYFQSEHCDIEIWSYHGDWRRISLLRAFQECRYFKKEDDEYHTNGNLDWNPIYADWVSSASFTNKGSDLHKTLFASDERRKPVHYMGEIKMGNGTDCITEKAFMNMAKSLCGKIMARGSGNPELILNNGISIVNNISQSPYNEDFFRAVSDKNSVYDSGSDKPRFLIERNMRNNDPNDTPEFVQDGNGSLLIPDINDITYDVDDENNVGSKKKVVMPMPEYPPGFSSFGCLKTLAQNAFKKGSIYEEIGKSLRPFVEMIESISASLGRILPHSIINDADNIPSWIHNNNPASILFRALMNQNTCLFLKSGYGVRSEPMSISEQYSDLFKDQEVTTKLQGIPPENGKKLISFVASKDSIDPNFRPKAFLMLLTDDEVGQLGQISHKDPRFNEILEGAWRRWLSAEGVYVEETEGKGSKGSKGKGSKSRASKGKPSNEDFSGMPELTTGPSGDNNNNKKKKKNNNMYRTPLIATPGILNSIDEYSLVLPADASRNYQTFLTTKEEIFEKFRATESPIKNLKDWKTSFDDIVKVSERVKSAASAQSGVYSRPQKEEISHIEADLFNLQEVRKSIKTMHGKSHDTHHEDEHSHSHSHPPMMYSSVMGHNIEKVLSFSGLMERMCALAILFCTHVPSTIEHMIMNDIQIPFGILLLRPSITHRTSAPILVAAGNNGNPDSEVLGGVYYMPGFPMEGLDHSGNQRIDFNWYMGGLVKRPERVFVQHNAVPVCIVSGCNENFFGYHELTESKLSDMTKERDRKGVVGSLISVVVPSHYHPSKNVLHLCTRYSADEKSVLPGGDFFDNWVAFFSDNKERLSTTSKDEMTHIYNAFGMAIKTTCYRMNLQNKQWDIRDSGTSHNSDLYRRGAARCFDGIEPFVEGTMVK